MQNWMLEAIAGAIRSAWEEGCPVAGGDAESIASFADRRLRSFERRAKKSRGRLAPIDDLGKGLAQHFGAPGDWATPLQEDLRYLATKIVDAAAAAPWERAKQQFPAGSLVDSSIRDVQPFGVFVHLPESDVPGLVQLPDLFPLHSAPAAPEEWPAVGSSIKFRVIGHAEGRRQVDVHPIRYTAQSGTEIICLSLDGVDRDGLAARLAEVVPLDPPLATGRSWDAILDSVSGGLILERIDQLELWVTGLGSLEDADASAQTFRSVLNDVARDLKQSPPIGSGTTVRIVTDHTRS